MESTLAGDGELASLADWGAKGVRAGRVHGSQPGQIQDDRGPEARATPARRPRLPDAVARAEAGGSGSSRTALPGSQDDRRNRTNRRKALMTGFCVFCGFCGLLPESTGGRPPLCATW